MTPSHTYDESHPHLCAESGLLEPEFQLDDGFMTVIRRPITATPKSKVGSKVGSKVESALAMNIFLLISNEETISKASIARLLEHKWLLPFE